MSSTSGTRRGTRSLAAAIIVVMISAEAAAQPAARTGTPASSEARAHFERGVTLYDETDYQAALVEFKRAYAIAPTWQVLFNIGQAYFQVRNYAEALATLHRFIDEGGDQIPAERQTLVRAELADLGDRIGYVNVRSNLVGATVSIDARAAGATPLREPALVSVGVRKISAIYPGRQPVEKEVSVPAGETVDVYLDFEEPSPASTQATDDETPEAVHAPEAAPPPRPRNLAPAIVSLGAAAAGAVAGAIFGSLALRDKSRLNGECTEKACRVGSQADIDAVSRDATISTIGFSVMAVGLAVGVGLWLTAKTPDAGARNGDLAIPRKARVSVRILPGYVAGSF
jgi:hypothetical protein